LILADIVRSTTVALNQVADGNDVGATYTMATLAGRVEGGLGPAAVPALAEALKNQNADIRQSAAFALGEIGSAAADAVPALVEALKDQYIDVRQSAADALESLRQKS
jgi:HEAT repeat protein